MDENNKELELTPEERTAEEEAAKEVTSDELRAKIADELGINPDEQSELLDKLVEREDKRNREFKNVIRQKRDWREKAQRASETPKGDAGGKGKSQNNETPDIGALVSQTVREVLEARDIESLGLSDELKAEVKDLAKVKGISVREAAQLPYIQSRKAEIEKAERIKQATPKRSNNGTYTVTYDASKPLNPEDFKTPDGNLDVKAWKEAKAARAKYRNQ